MIKALKNNKQIIHQRIPAHIEVRGKEKERLHQVNMPPDFRTKKTNPIKKHNEQIKGNTRINEWTLCGTSSKTSQEEKQ